MAEDATGDGNFTEEKRQRLIEAAHQYSETQQVRAYKRWADRFPQHVIEEVPETEEERRAAIEEIRKRVREEASRRKFPAGVPRPPVDAWPVGPTNPPKPKSIAERFHDLNEEEFQNQKLKEEADAEEASRICIWCGEVQPSLDALAEHEEECQP